MGAFGRRRVENELEWRYEAPKLIAAYRALWAQPACYIRSSDLGRP
jgi:hypothetical protein